MKPRIIAKTDMEKTPYIVWNTFIDMIACGDITEMNAIQKKAALCFWYDSEIQNGGLGQYFDNQENVDYRQLCDALQFIGANRQAIILQKALTLREHDEDYSFLDMEYGSLKPEIIELLEKLLDNYQEEFIVLRE